MFRHLRQDRVLQLLQGLSAQGVDGSVGNKYIFPAVHLQTFKIKEAAAGLPQAFTDLGRCRRPADSRLYGLAGNGHRRAAAQEGQLGRLARCHPAETGNRPLRGVVQITAADLFQDPFVRSGITGQVNGDQAAAVLCMIIAGPDPGPDVEAAQLFQIPLIDLPGRLSAVPVPV